MKMKFCNETAADKSDSQLVSGHGRYLRFDIGSSLKCPNTALVKLQSAALSVRAWQLSNSFGKLPGPNSIENLVTQNAVTDEDCKGYYSADQVYFCPSYNIECR